MTKMVIIALPVVALKLMSEAADYNLDVHRVTLNETDGLFTIEIQGYQSDVMDFGVDHTSQVKSWYTSDNAW